MTSPAQSNSQKLVTSVKPSASSDEPTTNETDSSIASVVSGVFESSSLSGPTAGQSSLKAEQIASPAESTASTDKMTVIKTAENVASVVIGSSKPIELEAGQSSFYGGHTFTVLKHKKS